MESSSAVRGDASSFTSSFETYDGIIDGLASSWEGLSYDNIKNATSLFSSTASGFFPKRLEDYANACDEYEELKKNYNEYKSNKELEIMCRRIKDSFSTQDRTDYPFKYQKAYNDWNNAKRERDDYQKKYKQNLEKMKSYLKSASSGSIKGPLASSTVSYSIKAFKYSGK